MYGSSRLPACVLAFMALPAAAGQERASFAVSAHVPVSARLVSVGQPAHMVLTDRDVAAGRKLVTARYEVRHNAEHGYLLKFISTVGLSSEVRVSGPKALFVLRDEPVDVHCKSPPGVGAVDVAYQIVLRPGVRPGTYPWPVRVEAVPL